MKRQIFTSMIFIIVIATTWSNRAKVSPMLLPIVDTLDDDVPLWAKNGMWTHSETYRSDSSGMGWGIQSLGESGLLWNTVIDLRATATPKLRFLSKQMSHSNSPASILIFDTEGSTTEIPVESSSGEWTEVVIDLTGYSGHQIVITWSWWNDVGEDDYWMIDNVVIEDTSPLHFRVSCLSEAQDQRCGY
jgi:hypothetical protein